MAYVFNDHHLHTNKYFKYFTYFSVQFKHMHLVKPTEDQFLLSKLYKIPILATKGSVQAQLYISNHPYINQNKAYQMFKESN